ncbi:MAG: VRR-NUC domain-containing protein [Alphaproteobacteria bacterium]|nr:VRR-NUC domain-containing protein [Alphaproteobacteria bacterium]
MKIQLTEAQIEHQILSFLESKRIFAWKNPSAGYFDAKRKIFRKQASRFAINGVSDIIALHKGQAIFIEVKSKVGKESIDQKRFRENAQNSGCIAFVAKSVEDVYRYLNDKGIL